MWAPGRINRASSMHSPTMSVASTRSSYAGSISGGESPIQRDMWQSSMMKTEPVAQALELQRRDSHVAEFHHRRDSVSTQGSHSTLALEMLPEDEMNLKTPTVLPKRIEEPSPATIDFEPFVDEDDEDEMEIVQKPAGPLEQQLLMLLSKVKLVERDQPTVMAEDYKRLEDRIAELEAEKKTWARRHEALFALRDDDLANLIKVRCLLAEERRQHDAMKQLRDDDLQNVLQLREKLAQAAWTRPASSERSQSRLSMRQSVSQGNDLWQYAKTAAMEQRVLELEKANEELRSQNASGGASPSASPGGAGKADFEKIESLFEESLRYREKMATKVQQLRSEKEALNKEVAALEDRNAKLESLLERLQRKAAF